MICPKCGFEQPESAECMRCGVIVSRYKGPVAGAGARDAVAAVDPVAPAGTVYGEPGGTLYDGPPPVPAGGGTVYGGPPPLAGAVARPAFRGSFEIGKVLSESFSVYFSNFIPFVLLTALALSPLYLVQAYITANPQEPSTAAVAALLVLVLGSILCPYIATGAITFGVFQQIRGKDASIGDCLSRGLSSLFPVLGLAIVQGIRILIGLALCLVPGILWSLQLAVSVPAAVEERPGISGAMERSKFLTDGFKGDVFGVLFVLGILNGGLTLVVTLATVKNPPLQLAVTGVINLLTVGLSATATAVMYYRLRSIKESIDVEQISSVFA